MQRHGAKWRRILLCHPTHYSPAGSACGIWDGRRDWVHFFELHLDCMPEPRLDNREIVTAHLASPEELGGIALTKAVTAYLGRDFCC